MADEHADGVSGDITENWFERSSQLMTRLLRNTIPLNPFLPPKQFFVVMKIRRTRSGNPSLAYWHVFLDGRATFYLPRDEHLPKKKDHSFRTDIWFDVVNQSIIVAEVRLQVWFDYDAVKQHKRKRGDEDDENDNVEVYSYDSRKEFFIKLCRDEQHPDEHAILIHGIKNMFFDQRLGFPQELMGDPAFNRFMDNPIITYNLIPGHELACMD